MPPPKLNATATCKVRKGRAGGGKMSPNMGWTIGSMRGCVCVCVCVCVCCVCNLLLHVCVCGVCLSFLVDKTHIKRCLRIDIYRFLIFRTSRLTIHRRYASHRECLRQNPGAAGVHKQAKSQFGQHQQPGCPHTWAGFSLCHAPPPWLLAPLLKYTGTQGLNNRSAAWQQGHGVVYAEICSGNLRAGYNCNDRTQHPAVLNPPTT